MSKVNLETFLSQFYNEYNDLTSLVAGLKQVTDPVEKVKLSQEYEKLQAQTTALQKYLTENTQFIPAYETRKAQEHLAKLAKLAQDKRDEIFPKKKFGFKSKQKMATLEDTINSANAKNDESDASKKREENLAAKSEDAFLKDSSCTIRDIDGQTLIKLQAEINGKDIGILNIRNSTIILQGNPSVLHAKNIENCVILCGPISGSAFVNNLKHVKLVIGCHQLRIHESTNSEFYIHLGSRAIIEHCSTVRFAPYAWTYPELGEHFAQSTLLNANQDNWQCIDDFDWLNQTKESPNWSFMKEEERLKWTTNLSAPNPNPDQHKKTKRVNIQQQCQLPGENEDEVDPVIEKLTKVGCLEQHYKVQDCYFDTKDWRKCVKEVKEFQDCLNKSKKKN